MAICICKHTERKYFYIATYFFFFFKHTRDFSFFVTKKVCHLRNFGYEGGCTCGKAVVTYCVQLGKA